MRMTTSNFVNRVFDILEIEPYERFYLKGFACKFYIDDNLVVHNDPCYNCNYDKPNGEMIAYILRGNYGGIIKIEEGERENEQ